MEYIVQCTGKSLALFSLEKKGRAGGTETWDLDPVRSLESHGNPGSAGAARFLVELHDLGIGVGDPVAKNPLQDP